MRTSKRARAITGMLVFLLLVLSLSATASAADNSINIIINGKAVNFTADSGYPFIDENGRTMVPLRVTMEAAGAAVGWDAAKKTAVVITEHDRIEVPVGVDYLYNNNTKIQNDTVAVIRDGRTYLPIRAVLESADFTVEWDGATRTVNAYSFNVDGSFVPYATSNIWTLLENLLSGNVVYANGQYYATPEHVKLLVNTQVTYTGADLNQAIYPQGNDRYGLADLNVQNVQKEWVTLEDLRQSGITFDSFPVKGFYGGLMGSCLYSMPSIPDDFSENPISGIYDGITIKVENGAILFYQDDLLAHNVLKEKITELKAVRP